MTASVRQTRMMKLLAMFLTLALAVVGAGTAHAKGTVGDKAPAFELVDTAGKPVKLADLKGKIVVVDFWAAWCKPCKKELPQLDALAKKYAAAGAPVVIVAINIDGDRANATKAIAALGLIHLTVLFDPASKAVEDYGPPTMPTSYVVDKTGVVRYVNDGYSDGDEKKIAASVDKLIR